jgi:TetR/AcrR family tetracycline transcriptional repressor
VVRPKVPLISRRRALEAALKIIDERGLEGLSIRRLADALGVNGASLYHHFENKEDILVGAAELALADVRTPTEPGDDWRDWLPANARNFRNALLAHPALLPVIVGRRAAGMGAHMLDTSAARLIDEGVPSAAVMPLLDALELFAIGSALHETQGDTADDQLDAAAEQYPALAKAMADRGLSSEALSTPR